MTCASPGPFEHPCQRPPAHHPPHTWRSGNTPADSELRWTTW